MTYRIAERRRRSWWVVAAMFVALAIGAGIYVNNPFADDEPPPSPYNETEAYYAVEQAVADTIAVLPDFPGFERRFSSSSVCMHNGVDNPDYVRVEVNYLFSEEVSHDSLVREQYLDLLRDHWTNLGYNIHRDESDDGNPPFHSLEARRPDDINFWYRVAGFTDLTVQSGCSPVTGNVPDIPPHGGATDPARSED